MATKTLTSCFLAVWILSAVLYDWWAFRHGGRPATITVVVQDWIAWCPLLAVLIGCVLWHLFGVGEK